MTSWYVAGSPPRLYVYTWRIDITILLRNIIWFMGVKIMFILIETSPGLGIIARWGNLPISMVLRSQKSLKSEMLSLARTSKYMKNTKVLDIKIFQTVKELSFTFFRIWTSAKPRPIPNVIWQSRGLHLVNTNVYAKFHHNIPLSSRDRAIFTFFQNVELLGEILSISMFTQISIKIFYSVQAIRPFSLFSEFGARQSLDRW